MSHQNSIPADIASLAHKFDQWRSQKRYKNEPIPKLLREEAKNLLRHHQASLVCKALRLNYHDMIKGNKSESPATPAIQVTQVDVSGELKSPNVVKLTRPDGLTLELTGGLDSQHLGVLINAFCRGGQ